MGSSGTFWVAMWAALLLPAVVAGIGVFATLRKAKRLNPGYPERDRLPVPRLLTVIACFLPALEVLVSLLPEGLLRTMGPSVMLFIPVVGGLSGVSGAILSGISCRGVERWTSPAACMMASALLVLLTLAGA